MTPKADGANGTYRFPCHTMRGSLQLTIHILAVSGSLQARSSNEALLVAAARLVPSGVTLERHPGLDVLPHFNPDLEAEGPPLAVVEWRAALARADALLIACPEYAHGMPGVLKNSLDWVVGSGETVGKPTGLVSASTATTGGVRALLSLTQVLTAMSTPVIEAIGVPLVRGKLDADGELQDPDTLRRIADLLVSLARAGKARVAG